MSIAYRVLLDLTGSAFGSAFVGTDVTSWAVAGMGFDPITVTWGRQDQYSAVSPVSVQGSFWSTDGRFIPALSGLNANLLTPDVAAPGCVSGGTSQFVAGTGGTLAIDTSGHTTGNSNSLRVTVAAGTAASSVAHTPTFPVTVGLGYSAGVDFDNTATGTVGVRVRINFLNGSGTILSGVPGGIIAAGGSGTSTVSNAVAPVSAVTARLDLVTTAVPGAPAVFYAGNLEAEQAATPAGERVNPYYPNYRRRIRRQVWVGTALPVSSDTADSITVVPAKDAPWTTSQSGSGDLARYSAVPSTDSDGRVPGMMLRSFLAEEMILDSPTCVYMLQEAEGSVSFADATGACASAVVQNSKYGPGVVTAGQDPGAGFVAGTVITLENAAYSTWATPGPAVAGSWLHAPNSLTTSGSFSFEVWVQSPTVAPLTSAAIMQSVSAQGLTQIALSNTGVLTARVNDGTSLTSVTSVLPLDGLMHQLALTYNASTKVFTLYVDSVATTVTGASTLNGFLGSTWELGMATSAQTLGVYATPAAPFTGGFAYMASWPTVLSAARVLAHYNAGENAFSGEATDTRFTRLMGYRPNSGVYTTGAGNSRMGIQTIQGASLGDALQQVADVEGGVVYDDATLGTVLAGRSLLFNPGVITILDCAEGAVDFPSQFTDDTQGFVNDVTVSRDGGSDQRYYDPTSAARDGFATTTATMPIDTDQNALAMAAWIVQNGIAEAIKITPLQIDLIQMAAIDFFRFTQVLSLTPLNCVTLINLPPGSPAKTMQVIVQGGTYSLAPDAATLTLNTTPLPPTVVVVDGDAAHGVDSTAIIAP